MVTALFYTGAVLNRAGERRADQRWMESHLDHPELRVVPVWRDRHLVITPGEGEAAAVMLSGDDARKTLADAQQVAFLGLDQDVPHFAADLSHRDEADLADMAAGGVFEDLRQVGSLLGPEESTVLAYARGILYWHRRNRFCGDCGAPTEAKAGGHVRTCVNPTCGARHFPRTDPAVIMLATDEEDGVERCLLGWSKRWDFPMYSTLAGFVEPGESLEEAVSREILEEAGIATTDVTYQGSQPWPFPSSLMLGFRARAVNREITICPHEMRDVRWFTRNEVRDFDRLGLRLPRPDSIANFLISSWLDEAA